LLINGELLGPQFRVTPLGILQAKPAAYSTDTL